MNANQSQNDLDKRLLEAAKRGKPDRLRELLASGASLEAKDDWDQTALHWAVGMGHVDCVRELLAKGASMEPKDEDGLTARELAEKELRGEIVAIIDAHIRMQNLLNDTCTNAQAATSPPSHRWGL